MPRKRSRKTASKSYGKRSRSRSKSRKASRSRSRSKSKSYRPRSRSRSRARSASRVKEVVVYKERPRSRSRSRSRSRRRRSNSQPYYRKRSRSGRRKKRESSLGSFGGIYGNPDVAAALAITKIQNDYGNKELARQQKIEGEQMKAYNNQQQAVFALNVKAPKNQFELQRKQQQLSREAQKLAYQERFREQQAAALGSVLKRESYGAFASRVQAAMPLAAFGSTLASAAAFAPSAGADAKHSYVPASASSY